MSGFGSIPECSTVPIVTVLQVSDIERQENDLGNAPVDMID